MYTAVPLALYLMIFEAIWAEAVCSYMTDRVETCYNELFRTVSPAICGRGQSNVLQFLFIIFWP